MDTRLTIAFVDVHHFGINEINIPQNIDAILVTEENRVILWEPGMKYGQVSYVVKWR